MNMISAIGAIGATPMNPADLASVADIDSRHNNTFGIGTNAARDTTAVDPTNLLSQVTGVGGTNDTFDNLVANAINALSETQNVSDRAAVGAAAGSGEVELHDVMVAQTEAALNIQLATTLRNGAVSAFNEILRTPL